MVMVTNLQNEADSDDLIIKTNSLDEQPCAKNIFSSVVAHCVIRISLLYIVQLC